MLALVIETSFYVRLACAAIQDVLLRTNGINVQDDAAMKGMLCRIVAMLTQMAMKFDGVAESGAEVHTDIDYDYEHRFAESRASLATNRLRVADWKVLTNGGEKGHTVALVC